MSKKRTTRWLQAFVWTVMMALSLVSPLEVQAAEEDYTLSIKTTGAGSVSVSGDSVTATVNGDDSQTISVPAGTELAVVAQGEGTNVIKDATLNDAVLDGFVLDEDSLTTTITVTENSSLAVVFDRKTFINSTGDYTLNVGEHGRTEVLFGAVGEENEKLPIRSIRLTANTDGMPKMYRNSAFAPKKGIGLNLFRWTDRHRNISFRAFSMPHLSQRPAITP